jgi:hypothetical protein
MSHFLLESPPRRRALAAAFGVLLSASFASADDGSGERVLAEISVQSFPLECRPFAIGPADARDARAEWQRVLSLAACLQDGSTSRVDDPLQLEELVAGMSRRLELPMSIYFAALEEAPASIQLRAAFQIGMAHVALTTRARSSIAAPPDRAALPRHRQLHDQLEPLLLPARQVAWTSFATIDRAAAQSSSLASDAVARHMIATARANLAALADVAAEHSRLQSKRAPPAYSRRR